MWLLIACAPDVKETGFVDDGQPHIFIDSPAEGTEVDSCFEMEVSVLNFEVVDPTTEADVLPGRGHWHVVRPGSWSECEALTCRVDETSVEAGAGFDILARLVDAMHVDVLDDAGDTVEDTRSFTFSGTDCPVAE